MEKKSKENELVFTRQNYIYLIAGAVAIIIGFLLMAGGASEDPAVFSEEVFSARRMYISPIVLTIGFGLVFYAIMKKPKEQ